MYGVCGCVCGSVMCVSPSICDRHAFVCVFVLCMYVHSHAYVHDGRNSSSYYSDLDVFYIWTDNACHNLFHQAIIQ